MCRYHPYNGPNDLQHLKKILSSLCFQSTLRYFYDEVFLGEVYLELMIFCCCFCEISLYSCCSIFHVSDHLNKLDQCKKISIFMENIFPKNMTDKKLISTCVHLEPGICEPSCTVFFSIFVYNQ